MKNFEMKKAFTIIEVMLVLGVSGMMIATMLIGWNANIEKQRYNDSVNTFKADLQSVFSDVENQSNEKGNTRIKCNDTGRNISITRDNSGSPTGSSNCVVLGKFISLYSGWVIPGNENVTLRQDRAKVFDVIGKDIDTSKDCNGACNNSIDALKATKFVIDYGKNEVNGSRDIELQWRGTYKNVTDNRQDPLLGNGRRFSGEVTSMTLSTNNGKKFNLDTITGILILRSPLDNSIISFGVPVYIEFGNLNDEKNITDFRESGVDQRLVIHDKKTVNVCVRPIDDNNWYSGGFNFFGDRNKVIKIGPSSAAVEVAPLDGANGSSCGGDRTGDARFGDVIIDGVKL